MRACSAAGPPGSGALALLGRSLAALAVAVVAGLGATACAADTDQLAGPVAASPSAGGQPVSAASLQSAATALCGARQQAASDVAGARGVFYALAHDRLHDLARMVQDRDRAAAARLLEAKAAVERDFAGQVTARKARADLERLVRATGAALGVLSIAPPACAGEPERK